MDLDRELTWRDLHFWKATLDVVREQIGKMSAEGQGRQVNSVILAIQGRTVVTGLGKR